MPRQRLFKRGPESPAAELPDGMAQQEAHEKAPDAVLNRVFALIVKLFDKDKDGMLGFHTNELANLVLHLLNYDEVRGGASDAAGEASRRQNAVHIVKVIASHPGFSGQRGVTPAALQAAAEAGVFQNLTEVLWSFVEAVLLKLLQRDAETARCQGQAAPPVTGSVKFAEGTKPSPATPVVQRYGWGAICSPTAPPRFQLPPQQTPATHPAPLDATPEAQQAFYRAMAPNFTALCVNVLGPQAA